MRRRLTRGTGSYFEDDSDPMNGVSNLADAMLVLAVGLMLALIMNQHISISGGAVTQMDAASMEEVDATEFAEALEDEDSDEGSNLEEKGTVYVDKETGTMYLVQPDGN